MEAKPKMTALKIMIGGGKGEDESMDSDECVCPKCGHKFNPNDESEEEESEDEESY